MKLLNKRKYFPLQKTKRNFKTFVNLFDPFVKTLNTIYATETMTRTQKEKKMIFKQSPKQTIEKTFEMSSAHTRQK